MTDSQHNEANLENHQITVKEPLSYVSGWMSRLHGGRDRMLQQVSALVQMESPTNDPPAVGAVQKVVADWAAELGGVCRTGLGGVLEVRFGNVEDTRRPVLLLGHLDTVWSVGTLGGMP